MSKILVGQVKVIGLQDATYDLVLDSDTLHVAMLFGGKVPLPILTTAQVVNAGNNLWIEDIVSGAQSRFNAVYSFGGEKVWEVRMTVETFNQVPLSLTVTYRYAGEGKWTPTTVIRKI